MGRYQKWFGALSSLNDFAFGVNAQWRMQTGMAFDPWAAFGAGLRMTSVAGASSTSIEFADVQYGGDYALGKALLLGPYVEGIFGYDLDTSSLDAAATVGLRLAFEP